MKPTRRLLALFLLVCAAVGVAACGDEENDDVTGGTSETAPATATAKRIVSLSPTATEILFAIDADKQVVAVDDQSNYPPEAPKTALSGFKPNVEAIAGYDPDLVIIANDTEGLVDKLKATGDEVLIQAPAKTLDDTYAQITELGRRTGREDEAKKLISTMRSELDELRSKVPQTAKGKRYYHELDTTYFSVTSKTFVGSVYGLLGLENIADAADKEGGGYPQLSVEYIVQSNPDIIFLADTKCCAQTEQTVKARPGWGGIAAVKSGTIVELDDDIASRWGPRVVELVRVVSQEVSKLGESKG